MAVRNSHPGGRPTATGLDRDGPAVPLPSPLLFRLFTRYVPGYLRRHFHAVRVARGGMPAASTTGPLVVCLNHPSWWDPLLCLLLATTYFPARRHYAPIDAKALGRYQFFRRLGFFGIEPDTRRGAAAFLRTGLAVLQDPLAVLWVTAAGRFTDVRERPVRLRPGVAHLARRLGRGAVLPLALEYPFWQERTPEALVLFGEPIDLGSPPPDPPTVGEWNALLESRLERAQDALATAARAQDASAFVTLLGGRAGVGGVYDLWRRLSARVRGERFQAEHGTPGPGPGPGVAPSP